VNPTSFTTATGMGPLPRILESAQGTRALERVFRAEGLPLWLAHDQSGKLPLRCMMGLFERTAREIGDELFGLNLGYAMQPEDYGVVASYMASAPDLRTMIRRSIRAVRYHASGCEFSLEVSEGLARWGFRSVERISFGRRHHAEHVVHPVIRAMRRYLGSNWSPLCVELEADRPTSWHIIEHQVAAPVTFGAATNAVVFEARLLERPALRQIPLKDLLTWSDLRRIVMQRPPQTSIEAAREIVRLRLFESTVDIEGAAKLLGVAPRTLQRQLAEENLTYRDMVQQMRMQRAVDLLSETVEPVTSIAYSLGYSDVASFTRVFRKWTGLSPTHFRHELCSAAITRRET
jgi:AraC-like DNA-binding protein